MVDVIQVILAGFRSGRFLVLVATNVAARGLDINDVQLIIQVLICLTYLYYIFCDMKMNFGEKKYFGFLKFA